MMRMAEENGARKAVLRQAVLFQEGLSYEAFLKVLIPQHQVAGRKLLQDGYLTRTDTGGITLSPLVRKNTPRRTAWDEIIRAFLIRLITSLAEAVSDYWKTQKWVEQARVDPEHLRIPLKL